MQISTYILTKNSEKYLARVIESIYSFSDEVIVVDDYSSDKTLEICCKYTKVRVYQRVWGENESEHRNYAIGLCGNEWIFNIDSDEIASPKLIKELEALKQKLGDSIYEVYTIKIKNYFLGKWMRFGREWPDRKMRFMRNKFRWTRYIHIVLSEDIPKSKICDLDGWVDHYTVDSIGRWLGKCNMYTLREAKMMYEKGKRFTLVGIFFVPTKCFISNYILRLGFLGGINSLVWNLLGFIYNLLIYIQLYGITRENSN